MSARDRDAHLISISRIRKIEDVEVSVLRLRGAVREETEADFRERIVEAGRRSPFLILDLRELDYVSAAGLGTLLDQARTQARRGGWFRLISPSPSVAMILRLAGITETLPVWDDEDKALSDLSTRAA